MNANFDRLWKLDRLCQSRDALKTWETARRRTDLTETEIVLLDRFIKDTKEQIEINKRALREWWT